LPRIALGLGVALLAFFVSSPFALLDLGLYVRQIGEQSRMVRGLADWPFTRQYRNTLPFVYQISQQVRWGLGFPLGVVAFAGFGWTVVRQFRRPRAEELVLLAWAIPYLLLTGTFMVKFMRYMLPLLPVFILMGAAMLWRVRDLGIGQLGKPVRERSTGKDARRGWLRRWGMRLAAWTPYLVLVLTFGYALAFTRVYAQTHPWIQASRWIYEQVPDESVIAVEHWDDHLPLALPEDRANPGAHGYRHVELPMYEPDNWAKYDLIRSRLREADLLVLSTNRLYRTIPRLPERYPVSTEFYRLLFGEKLGYVREAEFTAYPGIAGLALVDDDADESFTVYDHPKPIVFRKVRDLEDGEWDALFGSALAQTPVWEPERTRDLLPKLALSAEGTLSVGQGLLAWARGFLPGSAESGTLEQLFAAGPPDEEEGRRDLLLDRPVGELPVVADFGWNRWASESTAAAVVLWWLTISALGWLAWPLCFTLFVGLRDRGYLLSRMVGLLVVGYLIWLPSSLRWAKNGLPLTYAAIGLLALVSALLLWRNRARMGGWLDRKWKVILLGEAVFGLAFLAFVAIRILNPDLWQPWNGGEKLMDIAYLNSTLRSAYWPPPDPYYAHGYLNYYYYGQFLLSILIRLTGIRATVGFNLAVPSLFAFTVSAVFCVAYTLAAGHSLARGASDRAGRQAQRCASPRCLSVAYGIGHGLLAVLFVTIVGNLASITQVIERLGWLSTTSFSSRIPGLEPLVKAVSGAGAILLQGARFAGFNYWDPSRVVGFTINEFPYWSFLFADLHPHMINIPFTVLVLALALNWLLRRPERREVALRDGSPVPETEHALAWSSARYLVGRIDWGAALNWVIWPMALGALAAINTWDWPAYAGFSGLVLLYVGVRSRGKRGLLPGGVAAAALSGASLLFYAPFMRSYTPIFVGLGWSLGRTHTKLGEFLTVWGFFLFLSVTLLVLLLVGQRWRGQNALSRILRGLRLILRYPMRLNRLEELYVALSRRDGEARTRSKVGERMVVAGMLVLLALAIWWAWKGYWVLVLMVPLLALTAALLVQPGMPDQRRFVLALVFTAFLILVGVEFFYLKDHLDGDQQGWWRMNTLFKFYLQAWVMLGLGTGVSLPAIWHALDARRLAFRPQQGVGQRPSRPVGAWVWKAAFTLLLLSVILYPLLGTPSRVLDRFPGRRPPIGTLDGMAFMTVGQYTWPDENHPIELWGDYEAIRWLQENVRGTPVLAEAPIGYYREFGVRASSFTGLPTLVGMHESEQRWGWQVGSRSAQARDLYNTVDLQRTMELIRELDVEYVYLGPLENVEYPAAAEKFEKLADGGLVKVVFQNDLVTIYRVV
jgi:YYY domain-containing protein